MRTRRQHPNDARSAGGSATCHARAVRRVLVTGGASGIGAATADLLADEGWSVVRADVRAEPSVVALDVTDEGAWHKVVADCGPLHAVVTCAGIRERGMIVDTELPTWERHLRVNVTGTWLALRALLRAAVADPETPRAAVTIASVNATIAVPGQAHYVASKGAIAALTRAAALEGAAVNVRVNCVAPGPIRTPMAAERLADPDQVRWLTSRVPAGRVGEPEEVAQVVAFLLSERASYVNGEIVYADGGWAANAV